MVIKVGALLGICLCLSLYPLLVSLYSEPLKCPYTGCQCTSDDLALVYLSLTCIYDEFISNDTKLLDVKSLHIECHGTGNGQDAMIKVTNRLATTIDKLSLKSCKLQDIKAPDFGDVQVLHEVSISGTSLRSVDFYELASSLCGLESLSLTNNPNLTTLIYSNTDNAKQAPNCSNPFSNLTEFNLRNNHLNDIQPGIFFTITNLRTLNLKCNKLTQLDDEIFKPLSLLKNLMLANNPLIKIPILSLPNLQTLSLHDCFLTQINDTEFSPLSQLKYLNLAGNPFLTSIPGLLSMTSLTHLNISRLPQTNPISLTSFPPTLEILDLSNNDLSDLEALSFAKYQKIRTINLSNNCIQNVPSIVLKGLNEIEELNLSYNDLSMISFQSTYLQKLGVLDLSFNNIDTIPRDTFSNLPNLTTLFLNNNKISNISSYAFGPLNRNLGNLFLQNNKLAFFQRFPNLLLGLCDKNHNDGDKTSPVSVYMSGNPLICDCFMYEVLTTGAADNSCKAQMNQCQWPFTFAFSNQVFEDIHEIQCTDQHVPIGVLSELCDYPDFPFPIYSGFTFETYKECQGSHSFGRWFSCHVTDCPTNCSCSKNSEHAFLTDCANLTLPRVPDNISNRTTTLNAMFNLITDLAFEVPLYNVQKLNLSQNLISAIPVDAFDGFYVLRVLDLSFNRITEVNSNIKIPKWSQDLDGVDAVIYLQHNNIETVSVDSFSDFDLVFLDLHNNNIQTIENGTFKQVAKVGLSGNPLQCNCSLVWLKEWLLEYQSTGGPGCLVQYATSTKIVGVQPPYIEYANITCYNHLHNDRMPVLEYLLNTSDCMSTTPENEQSHLNKSVFIGIGFLIIIIFGSILVIFQKRHILKIMIDRKIAEFPCKCCGYAEDDYNVILMRQNIDDV